MYMSIFRRLLLPNVKDTAYRFPIPLLCAFFFTVIAIVSVHSSGKDPFVAKLLNTLLLSCFATVSVKLFAESRCWSIKATIVSSIVVILFMAVIVFLPQLADINLIFLSPAVFLSMFIAPYIGRDIDEKEQCYFNCAIIAGMFFATVAAVFLFAGLAIALASIGYLFEVKVSGKFYYDLFIIASSFFAPFYALSTFPNKFGHYAEGELKYPKGIIFMLNYIFSSLLIVYFLILYAYTAKILLLWDLPKGNLAYMIIIFGSVGIATHFLAYPIKDSKGSTLLKLVCKYFYHTLVIPVILLFVAISTRLLDYGVTEKRYVVLLLAVWLAFSTLYVILTRARKLKLVPTSLCILLFLASFGPWGAVSVSERSQISRLEELLEKNGILQNGHIVRASKNVSFEDRKNISSIIDYMIDTRKLDKIKSWFSDDSAINKSKITRISPKDITLDMGIIYVSKWEQKTNAPFGDWFSVTLENSPNLLRVKGFDYVINVIGNMAVWPEIISIDGKEGSTEVKLELIDDNKVSISLVERGIKRSVVFDIDKLIFRKMKPIGSVRVGLESGRSSDNMILTGRSPDNGLLAKLYIRSVRGNIVNKKYEIHSLSGIVLLKIIEEKERQ